MYPYQNKLQSTELFLVKLEKTDLKKSQKLFLYFAFVATIGR